MIRNPLAYSRKKKERIFNIHLCFFCRFWIINILKRLSIKDLSCIFCREGVPLKIPMSYYEIHQWLLLMMINKVHQIKGLMFSIIVKIYPFSSAFGESPSFEPQLLIVRLFVKRTKTDILLAHNQHRSTMRHMLIYICTYIISAI
jgi:hypothetical protein